MTTKHNLLTSMIVALALTSACDDEETNPPPVDAGRRDDAGFDAGPAGPTMAEAEILGVLAALNEGALELGMLGQECNSRAQAVVTDLTQDIVSDHAAAKARQSAFGVVPTDSPTATALRAEFHAEAQALYPYSSSLFTSMWTGSQMKLHIKVVTLIDEVLIPAATSTVVRAELTTVRREEKEHQDRSWQLFGEQNEGGMPTNGPTACRPSADAGPADAGSGDAGQHNADASTLDASALDASQP